MFRNLAHYLKASVAKYPDKTAVVVPVLEGDNYVREEKVSYAQLASRIDKFQYGWQRLGLKKGDRVIVLFKPSVDLFAVIVSLIAMGLVPVFIDTGMPKKKILMALSDSKAKAIVSLSALVKMFWFIPSMWRMKRFAVDGRGFGYRNVSWLIASNSTNIDFKVAESIADDQGLISFTSGSTGRPKGADRTQGSLENQHLILRSHLPDMEGDIDMTCFPVWVLHNLSCGMTTVLPKADLAKPGEINPRVIYEQLKQFDVTRVSAAPAFMGKLVQFMVDNKLTLANVNLAFTGGATVPVETVNNMAAAFPNAKVKIVYGSTEAEPISSVYASEFLEDGTSSEGYLVGKPVDGVEVCIAKLPDQPVLEHEVQENQVGVGDVGEILVSGSHVLKSYVDNEAATLENKVKRNNGSVWHRTGDTGFFDDKGRIWLTGRVKDVLNVSDAWIQPFPVEKKMDEIDQVNRSALVQAGNHVVLFLDTSLDKSQIAEMVLPITKSSGLPPLKYVLCAKGIPMDARHNSKIDRPLLREKLLNGAFQYSGVVE